tara:strand:- start:467 stop:640 length:174 start_codon:yes stop_codon:yes gene_type:complete
MKYLIHWVLAPLGAFIATTAIALCLYWVGRKFLKSFKDVMPPKKRNKVSNGSPRVVP